VKTVDIGDNLAETCPHCSGLTAIWVRNDGLEPPILLLYRDGKAMVLTLSNKRILARCPPCLKAEARVPSDS
jgi:hypothetical protein